MFFCLDELANIVIPDLPALVSEGGGQGLHVLACLQDLSQARVRWGDAAADRAAVAVSDQAQFSGISDPRTLEALSLLAGGDHQLVSVTLGLSRSGGPRSGDDAQRTTTQRQHPRSRVTSPTSRAGEGC